MKKLNKSEFEKFIDEIRLFKKEGFLEKASSKTIERYNSKLSKILKNIFLKNYNNSMSKTNSYLKRRYNVFIKRDLTNNHSNLKGWRLNVLKPSFKRELEDRIIYSLGLIKNNNSTPLNAIKSRFLNWCNNPNGEDILTSLKVGETKSKVNKHTKMILEDQGRKLISNFDNIVANKYEAIGFIWRTRRDVKVVGNPSGKNPKVSDPKMHGDHYSRSNKYYFFHNTWAIREKKINTKSKDFNWADFEDGLPGQPINCRCYAYYIYEIEDLPKSLLTNLKN